MRKLLPANTARQLRLINQMVAAVTGSQSDLAREVQAAINFSRQRRRPEQDWLPLRQAAQRLFELHTAGRERPAFAHCELEGELVGPLWLQQRVQRALRGLPPTRESLLLVTGLKQAVCPKGMRFTRRRQRTFEQSVAMVQGLAAASSKQRKTHVIVF